MPSPVIVVEVLSPGTRHIGNAAKLEGYFALLSVFHYLIVDTEKRVVIHHARSEGDLLKTRIVRGGKIEFDPPGLTIEFDACFNAG